MYIFKTSGATFEGVIDHQRHAFVSKPGDWNPEEYALISKNRRDLSAGEKQIQYIMKIRDIRPIRPGEAEEYWPGNEGRWKYIVECYDIVRIPQPFNLNEVLKDRAVKYRPAVSFKKLDDEDEKDILDHLGKMRYWCISTSAENWKICRNNSIWGMDARYFETFEKFLKSGDKAVVYTHGGKFVAVVEFIGDYFHSEEDLGWKKGSKKFLFPYRIKFKIIHESNSPPKIKFTTEEVGTKAKKLNSNLIDDISFIADKGRTWNQYLQVSIIRITNEDCDTICDAIRKR